MTRKKTFFNVVKKASLALTLLGKPFYKTLTFAIIAAIFFSTLVNKTAKKKRFVQIKLPHVNLSKKLLLILPTIIFLTGIVSMYKEGASFFADLPDVTTLPTYKNFASTKVYDRNGKLMYKFYDGVDRTPLPLSDIPLVVRQATLAAEDHDFYSHHGVSPHAIARALYTYVKKGRLTGASTITQQLVKNVYLSPERTIDRKLREMVLALQVERMYTKDQILEFYLNRVPYGGISYGIQEAARSYFNKNIKDVTAGEAAFLASLPQNPSLNHDAQSYEADKLRRNEVLSQMKDLGYLSDAELQKSQNEDLAFKDEPLLGVAPHFVMYIRDLLVTKYGKNTTLRGGLSVRTTIDPTIQLVAQNAVNTELKRISNLHVTNAGVLVLSVKTGEILAMVGSHDYNDFAHGGNVNTTTSIRPPGSSIKLVNYAYALSHGYTPATLLDDSPVSFKLPGAPAYTPQNYDGTFKGRMPLREALAQSRNIPAVRVLASYGVAQMVEMGQKMGITTWNDSRKFGLSLTLGGGGVTLLDLSSAYLTVANLGKRLSLSPISGIYDVNGKKVSTLCAHIICSENDVLDPRVAFQLIDILSDNAARTPAFGPSSALVVPGHPEVAVKTGTSNDLRDNLTLGFNQDYLVAVWVGNNDNSPMSRVASGVTGASPIWNSIMTTLLKDKPSIAWNAPSGLNQVALCGKRKEWFLSESTPKVSCGENVASSNVSQPLSGLPIENNF